MHLQAWHTYMCHMFRQAIFYPVGGAGTKAEAEAKARELHTSFLATYHITEQDVPLLSLDVTDPKNPFAEPGSSKGYKSYDSYDDGAN